MKHICNAIQCTAVVSAQYLMCPSHWRQVPKALQDRIYAAYRANPGRTQRLSSINYLTACAEAVEHLANKEGHPTRNTYRRLAEMVKAGEITQAAKP